MVSWFLNGFKSEPFPKPLGEEVCVKYQLIALGPSRDAQLPDLQTEVEAGFLALGLEPGKYLEVLDASGNIDPTGNPVGVWFAGPNPDPPADLARLQQMLNNEYPVLPLVGDLTNYQSFVPQRSFATQWSQWDNDLVPGDILRLFRLTRESRQAFISYRRKDAQEVANQLFDALSERGYLPFLDTASVESSDPVQQVLHDRLADMDLVVFLDSPTAPASTWIIDELTTAGHLGLGVLQLVWPDKAPYPSGGITRCHLLQANDFINANTGPTGILDQATLESVLQVIEHERIQSLGSRRRRVISEFLDQARGEADLKIIVHPTGPLEVRRQNSSEVIAWAIPFVGLPDGWTVFREHSNLKNTWESYRYDLAKLMPDDETRQKLLQFRLPTRIVYDTLGVRPQWLRHLEWLSAFLPAKTLPIDRTRGEAENPVSAWLRQLDEGDDK